MKRMLLFLVAGLSAWSLQAQEESVLRAALYLSGAATEEEIPADLTDRLESEPTVRINSPHLKAGLLITDYQVACIRDYRAAHGDILSAQELALVDGFGADATTALAPFLSFASSRLPGQADTLRTRATALLRGDLSRFGGKLKASGESARTGIAWRAGGAWRGQADGSGKADGSFYADASLGPWRLLAGHFNTRWGQGLAAWSGFAMESLSTVSAFVKRPTGLSPVWSYAPSDVHRGMALEYSGTRLRAQAYAGIGHDYGLHACLLGRSSQLGFTFLWADASPTLSLDARLSSRHALLTAELAYRPKSLAFKTAAGGRLADAWKWAAQARVVPSRFSGKKYGEYGAAVGLEYASRGSSAPAASQGKTGTGADQAGAHTLSLTADASFLPIPGSDPRRVQLRMYGSWRWQFTPHWQLDTRLTERYRNYESPRTALRLDLKFTSAPSSSTASRSTPRSATAPSSSTTNRTTPSPIPSSTHASSSSPAGTTASATPSQASATSTPVAAPESASASPGVWLLTARLETVHCGKWGVLTYLEGGRKNETSAIYLRVTGFSVSAWDARIYCYERDAPGTFSVPAYNGRGLAFSAVGSLKVHPFRTLARSHPFHYFTLKANLRAACQLRTDRRPAYTLALQLQADL